MLGEQAGAAAHPAAVQQTRMETLQLVDELGVVFQSSPGSWPKLRAPFV